MAEFKFSDNYKDLCSRSGVTAGFQFEFNCQRCNDTWRSAFVSYRSGQAAGWIGKAAGFFGGALGGVGSAVEGLAESSWGTSRDEAFKGAIDEATHHFHRCAKCHHFVCDICWNAAKGLCLDCAPSTQVEIEAARAQGEVQAAAESAAEEGMARGKKLDVKSEHQLVCPECATETHGAKFCPQCGHRMADQAVCPACAAPLPAGAKFCTECGHKVA